MERQLLVLHAEGDTKTLIEEVKKIDSSDLKQLITARFHKGRSDAVALVRALLAGKNRISFEQFLQ